MNQLPLQILFLAIGVLAILGALPLFLRPRKRKGADADPRNWRAGIFYFNREDPALFVRKRFGIGYTINFANPWSWVIGGVLALVVLAPFLLTMFALLRIRAVFH